MNKKTIIGLVILIIFIIVDLSIVFICNNILSTFDKSIIDEDTRNEKIQSNII